MALLAVAQPAQSAAQLVAELRAKDIDQRLAAIDAVVKLADAGSERLLIPLLRDKDWEIQERIARALGQLKSTSSLSKLVDLAVDGECVRLRRAAALAVAAIDPVEGAERIFKKAKSKRLVTALEALALVLRAKPAFEDADKLLALAKDDDVRVREAAAVAWLEGAPDRATALKSLLGARHLVVRCLALEAVAESPRSEDLVPLVEAFSGEARKDVVERRILRALAAVLAIGEGNRAAVANAVLDKAGEDGLTLLRRARIVPMLAAGEQPVFDQKDAVQALRSSLRGESEPARAAAAKALREIGGEQALAAACKQFESETSPRARLQLVETVQALREPTSKEAVEWLTSIVTNRNEDAAVRERAIVRLGKSGVQGAAPALIAALAESPWQLACCAAVSLGKTDDDLALAPLQKLLLHVDWKKRGAAVVGLMHYSRDAAVDPLLTMLDDKHPVVARAAHEALRTMSRNFEIDAKPKKWRAWWGEHRQTHDFTDREATLNKLDKYGYAVPDSEIYAGLDVLVYKSRGDHIEQVLERLEIAYRTTQMGQVPTDGVHPEAIFVSNCTGELGPDDLEPLQWFVCTGGSLFGSCWALSQTIARIHPGVMQMAQTPDQVLDDVRALPVRRDSPLLTGVFPPSVVPIYHLEGAHLIDVLDPERCEVLIDSPDAAERHGCGNLAAWFFSGHGVLFDSANHFDLQGLGVVVGLKTAGDRQAYAMDHLGMTYATLRDSRTAAYWKSATKARESVPDLSAFRLLTNFVRSKRIGKY